MISSHAHRSHSRHQICMQHILISFLADARAVCGNLLIRAGAGEIAAADID
ncbi:hypothetical protein RLEG12_10840 (plasmid) [Rhizobium leguminosarum bv. trifolii CB782]|nr:hypothetical protein RLEG12_10840 [Rhizobium leguminosarum bv. trifolii CB782]